MKLTLFGSSHRSFAAVVLWLWVVVTATAENATVDNDEEDSMKFQHFIAHNKSMTCQGDEHARPFNNQVRGVNLGGWMVLEPVREKISSPCCSVYID